MIKIVETAAVTLNICSRVLNSPYSQLHNHPEEYQIWHIKYEKLKIQPVGSAIFCLWNCEHIQFVYCFSNERKKNETYIW